MKKIVAILFEIVPLIYFPLSCFLLYKYGDSSVGYLLFLVILCVPSMIHIGIFGDNLKRKYDAFFDYSNTITKR